MVRELSKIYVEKMLTSFDVLVNYVADRNETSKRWLTWLGFTLEEPKPCGKNDIRPANRTGVGVGLSTG
jgi:hypothetical protein